MDEEKVVIKMGGTWNNTAKSGKRTGTRYISTGWIKLSQEEMDEFRLWQEEGRAVMFQVWPNEYKKESRHPDHNLIMIRGDVRGPSEGVQE